jgi:hypothetical protein
MSDATASETPHYMKLPLWPDFDVVDQKVDGLIPACRVASWNAFVDNIGAEESRATREVVYRGQRRFDWPLESTLTRLFDGGAIPPDMANRMHSKFLLAMRGRGFDLSKEEQNEVWAFGQHYGLATPLLDWTESPFVSLFFAFVTEDSRFEKANPSRAIYFLDRSLLEDVLPDLFFEPSLGENSRLVNQAGLFSVTPDGNDNLVTAIINALTDIGSINPDDPNELARYIGKIHVPNEDREGCLHMMQQMNIHHANLFPDPSGASDYCNSWLGRLVEEHQLEQDRQAEIEKQEKEEPFDLKAHAEKHEDNAELLVELFVSALGEEFDKGQIEQFAAKVDQKYSEEAVTDWATRDSAIARIKVAFRRLLSSLGFPKEQLSKMVDELVDFYRMKFQANSR